LISFFCLQIFRWDCALYFANKEHFEDALDVVLKGCQGDDIHTLILDASGINYIDTSAMLMLTNIVKRLQDVECEMVIVNWKDTCRRLLRKLDFYKSVPIENTFTTLAGAVAYSSERNKATKF
jgi:anti-anti-sigma factor